MISTISFLRKSLFGIVGIPDRGQADHRLVGYRGVEHLVGGDHADLGLEKFFTFEFAIVSDDWAEDILLSGQYAICWSPCRSA